MTKQSDTNIDRQAILKQALHEIKTLRARVDAAERARPEPIAVLGMACRYPGAEDPEALWRVLRDGVDATCELPEQRWRGTGWSLPDAAESAPWLVRRGGFLDRDPAEFDARFFNISPVEAAAIDPQHRVFWETAWQALERAGRATPELRGSKTGVFVGITTTEYNQITQAGRELSALSGYSLTGNCLNFAAGRLSYMLGLRGPSMAIDTACSSSLVAVHLACQSLQSGEIDLAIVGGVSLMLGPANSVLLGKIRALSRDGRCKTFDASADGYGRSEGCGVVILARAADAQARRDSVLALLRGSAVGQDGFTSGPTVPSAAAQQAVIREALARANVRPSDVGYIEAHGTGTALGDPIELRALAAVLREGRPADRPFLLGSIKTNIGHPEAAAGIAGLIKVILCLQHGQIPPHLHLQQPNPLIAWDELPARIPSELQDWPAGDTARVAGVSSFGASGTNAHVVVAEAPDLPPLPAAEVDARPYVLPLSARHEHGLSELAASYEALLAARPELSLRDVAFTAGTGRSHFEHRLAVVANSTDAAREQLAAFAAGEHSAQLAAGTTHGDQKPRVAFVFTGQGSQYPGMGRRLYESLPVFRGAIEQCASVLDPLMPHPLTELLFPAQASDALIHQTRYTQPALFALEYALAVTWQSWGVTPHAVMGHSLGEIVAATVAGVLPLEAALRLVVERGRLIQALPAGGAMAAVFADEVTVLQLLAAYGGVLSIAAVNTPEELVISGERSALEALCAQLKAAGIKSQALQVSHAFHSPLMDPMLDSLERFAAELDFAQPQLSVISNVTGALANASDLTSPAYWRTHARAAVRFADGVRSLRAQGVDVFLELGPKPTLTAMGRRCLPDGEGLWLASMRKGHDELQSLAASLAALYANGQDIAWKAVHHELGGRTISLPTYPFQRDRHWLDVPERRESAAPARSLLPVRVASPACHAFEARLDASASCLLRDHVVHEQTVVSGVFHMAMALYAASGTSDSDPPSLDDVVFREALILNESELRCAQIVLKDGGFELFSRPDGDAAQTWTLHTTGTLGPSGVGAARSARPELLREARGRCGELVEGETFYTRHWSEAHYIGPSLRLIERLWRRDGEALAELRAPQLEEAERAELPAGWIELLGAATVAESCAQAFRAALPADDNHTYIGMSIARSWQRRDAGRGRYGHVTLRPQQPGDRELIVDVTLLAEDGEVLAVLEGFQLLRVRAEAFKRAEQKGPRKVAASRTQQRSAGPNLRELAALAPDAKQQALVSYLRTVVSQISGVKEAELHAQASLRDTGIDSLQAVDLRARVSADLSTTLSLGTLMQGPSLGQLAGILAEQLTGTQPSAAAPSPQRSANAWLRSMRRAEAKPELRLLCLPMGGAGASLYRGWQDALPEHIEVVAAQLPGREDRLHEPAISELSMLIDALAGELKPWLDRPFALFGASMGGTLAFELALRMKQQYGVEPRQLLIAATTAPNTINPSFAALLREAGSLEAITAEALVDIGILPASLLAERELLAAAMPAIRADCGLVASYRFDAHSQLDCPIGVIGGALDTLVPPALLEGWRSLTTGSCELQLIAADHQLLKTDRDAVLALVRRALA